MENVTSLDILGNWYLVYIIITKISYRSLPMQSEQLIVKFTHTKLYL